jgi:polyhydroxyalkanoate synthesis repressor PhaR
MGQQENPVIIKKYSNRRLYDTSQSKYIRLEDLATIVQSGTDIRVVAKSGADLSRQVLTQVILEQQDRLDMIPIELLHSIIRAQGTLQQAPLTSLLDNIASQLSNAGGVWAQQMNKLFTGFGAFGFGDQPAAPASETKAEPPTPAPEDPPAATAEGDGSTQGELSDLRKRMDELLDRLGSDKRA